MVRIFSLMLVSGTSDTADISSSEHFTSRNEDRISVSEVPMLSPNDVVTRPKGQAFALIEGGQLWKIRMPLPDPGNDPLMPRDLAFMAKEMEENYVSSDTWWLSGGMEILPEAALREQSTGGLLAAEQYEAGAVQETAE